MTPFLEFNQNESFIDIFLIFFEMGNVERRLEQGRTYRLSAPDKKIFVENLMSYF